MMGALCHQAYEEPKKELSMAEKTVTIPGVVYDRLLRVEKELDALHAGGVDNWDWYSESLKDAGLIEEEEED